VIDKHVSLGDPEIMAEHLIKRFLIYIENQGYVIVKKDELIKKAGLIVAEGLGVK